MEENKNNTQKQQREPMTPFCEALMKATEDLNSLRQPGDSAIIICSDGKTLASRTGGTMEDATEMLFSKMRSNHAFARVVIDAVDMFTTYLLKHKLKKLEEVAGNEEKPANTANIKPLN